MEHNVFRVVSFSFVGEYALQVVFDDQTLQIVDFEPVLKGAVYGPLKDPALFRQVAIDPEIQTLVWPNGADFDPETLHEWPKYLPILRERAEKWDSAA
ncbi:MAG: DUF2442 domain-containing protein [Desulfococcaceae bacterium]